MGFLVFIIIVIILILFVSLSGRNKTEISPKTQSLKRSTSKNYKNYSQRSVQQLESNPKKFWIKQNKIITIQGYKICSGLIYVGSNLAKVSSSYGNGIEPALVDPQLSIDKSNPDYRGYTLDYWPSYSSLSPNARSAYLIWLSNGKRNPEAPVGYVFLYFYGLERRLLHDLKGTDNYTEIEAIKKEIKRLLKIYGANNSFSRYASQLLALFELFDKDKQDFSSAVEKENLIFKNYYNDKNIYYSYDINFKKGLGYFARQKEPLPGDWALKWVVKSTRLNTPALRCKDKFQELFRAEYRNKFGDGIIINNYKDTLTFRYNPASSSFSYNNITVETNIPDFEQTDKYQKKLIGIIEKCTDKLDPYSRYLGRNPEDPESVEAISNLPSEIIWEYLHGGIESFLTQLNERLENQEYILVSTDHFTDYWNIKGVNKYRKKESIEIAQFFFKLGFGIEPDLRFGSAKFERDSQVIFFKINPKTSPTAPSKEYKLALLILHLTAVVGLADGTFSKEEKEYLDEYIKDLFKLSAEEKERLNAYLHWLEAENPGIRGIKRKINDFDSRKRQSILDFLIQIANADGYIDPGEVKMLQKTAEIFELDPDKIFKDIHEQQTTDDNPILVVKGDHHKGYTIPEEKQQPKKSHELDQELINKTLKQTDEVQSILTDIFTEEEEKEPLEQTDDSLINSIWGLDELHSKLVKQLLSKEEWTQMEYEKLCSELNLFPAGAQEVINDKAFEEYDDALLLQFDQIEINTEIAKQIQL